VAEETAESALGPVLEVERAEVRIGTCSWTDKTLVRESDWYPRKTMSAEERLRFYAAAFPVVEVDATYYRPPSADTAQLWAERTPDDFRFHVKAYSLLTHHPTRRDSLWEDLRDDVVPDARERSSVYDRHLAPEALDEAWRRFVDALEPLRETGKLAGVLFQYPPWFTNRREHREELDALPDRLGGLPVSVEFRSPTWLQERSRDKTLAQLERRGLTFVSVDAPRESGLQDVVAATTPLAVVRFHGRDDAAWSNTKGSASERFRYDYDEPELREWVPRVHELGEQAREVHLLFNNCYRDYAVRNGAMLAGLLGSQTNDQQTT
jgi:uncharacterized protein YecE (DUF72 family)